jgi:5-methylcytosine-specific restriction endonuclease McrA
MVNVYEPDVNPGHKLQIILKEIFPYLDDSKPSFISSLDDALGADGEFGNLVYDSAINYLVRRLISTARFFKRQIESEGLPNSVLVNTLRNFVERQINLPPNKTELIFTLLFECAKVSGRKPSSEKLKRMKRNAIREGKDLYCHICGIATNLVDENEYNSATLDHIWPNSLGGSSSDQNLRIVCYNCNKGKANYIEASDFHYEQICLSVGKEDLSFSTEMKRTYEVAIWSKNNFECLKCSKPTEYIGKLQFSRRNTNDSWHFLNIDAYCQNHARE